jgi:hypothetical protein
MAFPLHYLLTQAFRYTLMPKDKKKHSKKKDDLSDDILDMAALSIKKFRKVTKEIGKLSTGQKLVGGLALVAAGLTYLAQRDDSVPPGDKSSGATPADSDEEPTAPAHHKSHARRRKKAHDSED